MERSEKSDEDARQLVVVAFYDQRPIEPLLELFESMDRYDAGCAYDRLVVVNRSYERSLDPLKAAGITCLERDNLGMNIGAWDDGWRRTRHYDGYLFLQDECIVTRDNWLQAFIEATADEVGLVGESVNENWDLPWDELRRTRGRINVRGHTLGGSDANRVDVYLDFMARNGIDPGPTGHHLRGQVWYATDEAIADIGGFPQGHNYGECIGAEIAVSRSMMSRGWTVRQVAEIPFHYIAHAEWEYSASRGSVRHVNSLGRIGRLRRGLKVDKGPHSGEAGAPSAAAFSGDLQVGPSTP